MCAPLHNNIQRTQEGSVSEKKWRNVGAESNKVEREKSGHTVTTTATDGSE
jgi:hypothetical protein